MAESGYQIPPLQMEDVPINNHRNENTTKSKSNYVKPKQNFTPCLNMANQWDFYRRYKASVCTVIISMVALLVLSGTMIYLSLRSVDVLKPVNIETVVEEVTMTDHELSTNQDAEDLRDNTIRQYLYEIIPAVQRMKRDVRKLEKRGVEQVSRDAHKFFGNQDISKEIYKDTDEHRQNDKRGIENRQKMDACETSKKQCEEVLGSMQSLVQSAGRSVNDLNYLVQKIRLNEGSPNPDPKYKAFLQCMECGKMRVKDSTSFIDSDTDNPQVFYQSQNARHYHQSQMKNMSSVSSLLDELSSSSEELEEEAEDESPESEIDQEKKISVISTNPQKSGSKVQKTVEVSKSTKLSDGAEITQIIRNTTIVRKLNGKPENKETQTSPAPTVQPEISTSTSFQFDSLTPLRRRPTMRVINSAPFNPARSPSGWAETTKTRVLTDESPALNRIDSSNGRFYERETVSEPRILTGGHFQPSKSNLDGNSLTMPTAETMKSGQQVQITPYASYPVCYYGSPPLGAPLGAYKQFLPGMMNFPASSPGGNFPFAGNQYPNRGPSFSSQGFTPMQLQQQGLYGSIPGNVPTAFQQNHRVGPTGPGVQNFPSNFAFPPTAAATLGRIPMYCTFMPSPTYQFAPVENVANFQRSSDQSILPEPVWSSAGSNYPGYPSDCDQNSRPCSDGSRCIENKLWCDGHVDCSDASDEAECSCRDRLRKNQICDGYFDCPYGTDELGCLGCPEDSFSCDDSSKRSNGNENCVPLTQRCDGLTQCSNGKDEMGCTILTESYIENRDAATVGYTSGYLHKNFRGQWYPVCSETLHWAIDACSSENNSPISEMPKMQTISTPMSRYPRDYLVQSDNGEIKLEPTCFDRAINVICPQIPCGTTVLSQESSPPSVYMNTEVASRNSGQTGEASDAGDCNGTNGNREEEVVGDARIVGGRASQPKAWPFIAAIFKDGYFHCGGTIIDQEWVLTAAHCVDGFSYHYYEIQAGLLRRSSFSPMAQIRKAVHIKIYQKYDGNTMSNDLALIRLSEPLRFNRWVRPSCLPRNSFGSSFLRYYQPYFNMTCVAIGWGATAERGPDADNLREVEVPILAGCKRPEDQNDATICAGMPEGGRDACQGDSGGPLMCRQSESQNQWYIAGVVSHGDGCARRHEPGVYTKVSKFVDWIEEAMRAKTDLAMRPKPMDSCPGFSCEGGLGKCLPLSERCDRKVNCLDAEDEMNCSVYKTAPSSPREASNPENNPESNSREIVQGINPNPTIQTETEKKINETESDVPGHSGFTMDDYNEENSTTTRQAESITTASPVTQKNITDATTSSGFSTERPIVTTDKPQSSTQRINTIIDVPHFTCTNVLQSLPINKRCNRVFDCEDGTDEKNCTCREYLANTHPIAICDGHVDCHDRSDEDGCTICKENEFICSRSGKCIPEAKVCDHNIDCPYMEDEIDCFTLTNGNNVNLDLEDRPYLNLQGVVTRRRKNDIWRPACQSNNATVQARLSNDFCVYFGFGAAESVKEIRVKDSPIETRYSWPDDVIPYEYPPVYTVPDEMNKTCLGLHVKCKPMLSINTSFIIATNPTNDHLSYLLPWEAHIFVDGRYHCPAILLDYSWLLSTSKCAQGLDLKNNYTMALLGTSPTYLYVDGPNQQKASIDFVTTLSKLDAAMMHLQHPVNMTRYVQPIFLEKKIFPATNKSLCIATGVNDKHETKSMYLRPEPQNCPPCHRCFRNATFEDCRNNNKSSTNWSGTVVCRGSSAWYPAAIFDEKDMLCGFQSPQTLMSIDYGFAHFTETAEKEFQPISGPACDGLRCPLGTCIPWINVCDGIANCRDGADEDEKYCGNRRELCEATKGIGCQCTKSELRCEDGQCVSKKAFCDGVYDCNDRSDEPDTCNCAAYLKLTAPERLCDNIRHCLDKSDENSETCLCKDASFKCTRGPNVTETCVSQDFVCDGEKDCANGEDETTCRSVQGTLKDPPGTGQVLRRSFGVWQSECFPVPITTTREISDLCRSMGYDFGTKLEFDNGEHPYGPPMAASLDQFFMIRLNSQSWINTRANKPLVSIEQITEPCHRAFVKCT